MRRDAALALIPPAIKALRRRKLPADAMQRVINSVDWDLVDDAGNNVGAVTKHIEVATKRALA
jgi:hypothetical protein